MSSQPLFGMIHSTPVPTGVSKIALLPLIEFQHGEFCAKTGFSPVRKPGKLPSSTRSASYALEYGTDTLEIHDDAVVKGQRVLIVDDLLATGGTAAATVGLVRSLGADVVGLQFLIELVGLNGRDRLQGERIDAVLKY